SGDDIGGRRGKEDLMELEEKPLLLGRGAS
ncbi:hypothetical protein A2U01_0119156, partial [Trifolium medium]|nr:hypothetical protein [Trifolium medium]